MNEHLTSSQPITYNKGRPIRCHCGHVVAMKDESGNITVKCRKCKRILIVVRAESLK